MHSGTASVGLLASLHTVDGQILSCEQAEEVGRALTWTMDNIERYGGDPQRIFLAGHSSGEHWSDSQTSKWFAAVRQCINQCALRR